MDPGTRSNSVNPSSLSRRSLRPVLSQAYIARLFVEANDNLWWRPHGGSAECWSYGDPADHYWAYDPERKHWHKCRETGGYIHDSYGSWQCDTHGVPYYDFRPAIFFDLMRILEPLLETATPADQRRCGSYAFLNNTIKYLEHHERIVMDPRDLRREPRPCFEAREEEERAERAERRAESERDQ
jgi:hypothetical protein